MTEEEPRAADPKGPSNRSQAQDSRRIDPALRKKYDMRGPRYTSYPPATHFRPVSVPDVLDRFREQNGQADDPGLSLYVHVPFCRARCLFCGCHTYISQKSDAVESYVDALVGEMRLVAGVIDPSRPVRQIAIGGGTPNFMEVDQIHRLLGTVEQIWSIDRAAELSVEIDPRTSTPGKLDALIQHGFNRFSLGIQDFSLKVLEVVRRGQGLMQVEDVVSHLRENGCRLINFDLIYGLPGQDAGSVVECARQTVELAPSRIALYSYAHVPWIHRHQKALEDQGLHEPELKGSLFHLMMDRFLEAGYEFLGMDHFALPEDPLAKAAASGTLRRNFMGYTTGRGLDIAAFGCSSISSIGSSYSQNDKELFGYERAIARGELPIVRGFLLDLDDLVRRELVVELFCNFHVDLDALSSRFGILAAEYFKVDLERLAPMVEDGLVRWTDRAIDVTDVGRFFVRNVCMTFDRYLESDPKARMYSRTI